MARRVLTPEERTWLRPTVSVEALERLLDRLGPGDRASVIDACYQNPGAIRVGISEDVAELMAGPKYGPSSELQRSAGTIRFENPELQRLWEAVEPSAHGAA